MYQIDFSSSISQNTNIALVQAASQKKTNVEIGRIAKGITLRIDSVGVNSKGSGILLKKQGNVYTVLTVAHVVSKGSSFNIKTPDNKIYKSFSVIKAGNGLDLAVVKFRSNQKYKVAEIGNSKLLEIGSEVYVAGFPEATDAIRDGGLKFTPGYVTSDGNQPSGEGYSLIYSSITQPGMSGGPVLNDRGQLVAIHGRGDRDASGQKSGFNLGIIIEQFNAVVELITNEFSNNFIQFDINTRVGFAFLESHGRYKSTLGVINLDSGEKIELFAEQKHSDSTDPPTNKATDFLGTPGNTVARPENVFLFKANTSYAFYLESKDINDRTVSTIYSSNNKNLYNSQQAKFSHDFKGLSTGGVVIHFEDLIRKDDDFNDFVIVAGGGESTER